MDEKERKTATLARHRLILLRIAGRVSIYYILMAAAVAIFITAFPSVVNDLPLGGVGEIAEYGGGNIYDLEEALLSADDEELEEIATATTRARLARGPIWLRESISLTYVMIATHAPGVLGLQSHSH